MGFVLGHPVTTDPLIIMVINMTVVFLVLILLMYVIKLIHFLDPTKEKEQDGAREGTAVQEALSAHAAEPPDEGIPEEVVAAIAAAVASCNGGSVRAIRPLGPSEWRRSGRAETLRPR